MEILALAPLRYFVGLVLESEDSRRQLLTQGEMVGRVSIGVSTDSKHRAWMALVMSRL